MDTDRAAADFHTIDDHVVGIRAHCPRIRLEHRDVLRLGRSEGVMHSVEALGLFIPLEEGEVNYPEAGELRLIAEAKLIAHFKTKLAELLTHLHRIIT